MKILNFLLPVATAISLLSCAHNQAAKVSTPRKPQGDMSDHNHKMPAAGWIEEDVNAKCTAKVGWSTIITKKQRTVINNHIAQQTHRLQHALWHSARGGLSPSQLAQVTGTWGPSWSQARPFCPPPGDNADDGTYNPVGEDFLYMHRQMILMLREQLVKAKAKCIKGWETFSDFEKFPVPGAKEGPKTEAALATFRTWDSYFQNPEWLKEVSLSQLGLALEFTIHNNLHMRFAEDRPAKEFQGKTPEEDGAVVPLDGNFPNKWPYDNPKYNWLADPYGAAVNPTFWRIHGYVDHIIDNWLKANGKTKIAVNCGGDNACYEWRGTWIGSINKISRAGGVKSGAYKRTDDIASLKARKAMQRLGIIENPGSKDGGLKTEKLPDPFETVKKRLCPGS